MLGFSFVALQRDTIIKKGNEIHNIHGLLEKQLSCGWKRSLSFGFRGCARCDHSVCSTHHRLQDSRDHIVKLLSKLMLENNVNTPVCLITKLAGEGVLDPDTMVTTEQNYSIYVRDALLHKYPEACVPPVSALPCCDSFPVFKDDDISGAHVQTVGYRIQSGAGPGGCVAAHWLVDALPQYGAHSECLRDSVATVACPLCINITPWDDVLALFTSQLFALDIYPGIKPIRIGETLHRVIGKAVCMA